MLDFIPVERLQSLHAATTQVLPEAKAIYDTLNTSDTASIYMFTTELRKRLRSIGLSDSDVELSFNAVMEELNPTRPLLSPADLKVIEDF
jgi:hypothetical protein